jgi:O-Antigen ligase
VSHPDGSAARVPGAARLLGAGVLLAGPTLLAFYSGGFFDEPRLVAGMVALALVGLVALFADVPLPRSWPGRVALAGLGGLAALTTLSTTWAPAREAALGDGQRVILYLAYSVAAAAILRPRMLARAVEPAIALGGLAVVGYALSARVLPGLVTLSASRRAAGRLEQPLTYWNAEKTLAAIGLIACLRLAGDPTRPARMRMAAAAASAPLGAGLYLTFSRGALAAAAAGVGVLFVYRSRAQLRGLAVCGLGAGSAGLAAGLLPGMHQAGGHLSSRELDGAIMLLVLAVAMALAALLLRRVVKREREGRLALGRGALPRWTIVVAAAAILGAAGTAFAIAGSERGPPRTGAHATRLTTVRSVRSSYWHVALRAFAHHPLLGVGSSGFRFEWLRHRDVAEDVKDAHSLYFETAAELGIAGLLALALLIAGVAAGAVRERRVDPELEVGLTAVLCVWAVAAALDWQWEMPAVTLPALMAAAAVIARADAGAAGEAGVAAASAREPQPVSWPEPSRVP